MTFSIQIDPADPHGSDHSLSDEEDSSGVQVSAPSESGSHEYQDYDEWAHLSYPDELKPSDSASRPRTSHRNRSIHGSRSASSRRQPSRRQMISGGEPYGPRARRHHSPESPGSADSEEFAPPYARNPHERRWPSAPPPPPGYAQSASSGPSYNNAYPPGHAGHYSHPNGAALSDQIVRLGHGNHAGQPYGAPYPYGSQFQPPHGAPMHPFFAQDPAHPRYPPRQPSQSRIDPHNPSQPPMPFPMGAHGSPAYAGSPFHHELMHFGPNAFYGNYREPYGMVPGMLPQSYFPSYPQVPSPPHAEPQASPAPAPAPTPAPAPAPAEAPVDAAKDEAIARLEKLILDERTERENKEAARLAAIEREAAEKAARDQQLAHDRKIAEEAAALARADAEKRAAEDAAKAKEEAEKAAAAAASEAAAAATVAAAEAATAAAAEKAAAEEKAKADEKAKDNPPPPEKKKPIKFKDAVGRKFSFPFELCNTWQGMEDLIKQAFLHIEVIGPHVAEGHYDLVGPNGDIILPQVWETVVEPDWAITMHMWPIPEKPKEPDPPPAADPPPAPPKATPGPEQKKKEGTKKPPRKPGEPPAFTQWMMGRRAPPRAKQAPKAEKKPEPAPQ